MPEWAELWEKLSKEAFTSYKRLKKKKKKDSDRFITPAVKAGCVPAHYAPPGSPQAKQLYHLPAQLSLGQSCHRQKSLVFTHAG